MTSFDKDKTGVLSIPVSLSGIGNIPRLFSSRTGDERLLITFVNPLACALARQHDDYVQLLDAFDIVACDGIGMVIAARACGLKRLQRESFDYTSLAADVFGWAARHDKTLGLVGGKPGVAEQAARLLEQKYPDLTVSACFSGYDHGPADARAFFNMHKTELVICGMGAPLQERFLVRLAETGWHGIGITCGGFLDQMLTGYSYYPGWVDSLNIRFLYRLAREPRRLWRRYLVDYQVFMGAYTQLQWQRLKSGLWPGKSTGTR